MPLLRSCPLSSDLNPVFFEPRNLERFDNVDAGALGRGKPLVDFTLTSTTTILLRPFPFLWAC